MAHRGLKGWWPFGDRKPQAIGAEFPLLVSFEPAGVRYSAAQADLADWLDKREGLGNAGNTVALLAQLEELGFIEREQDSALLRWESLFAALEAEDQPDMAGLLQLPPKSALRPALNSQGSLEDADFCITLGAWSDAAGSVLSAPPVVCGAIAQMGGQDCLLSEAVWRLVAAVREFHHTAVKSPLHNRQAWASIRRHALAAGAPMADFLRRTVVLTPEKLKFAMQKSDLAGGRTIQVAPGFDNAPPRWLEFFDRFSAVPERYDIPDGEGMVQVVLAPEVRAVLGEIRRWPGRMVSGQRAEAFIRNPYAALGEAAAAVIDEQQFEAARDAAGISFERFSVAISRDAQGALIGVGLAIESASAGQVCSHRHDFESPDRLKKFLARFEGRWRAGHQCCLWEGFELEILGDAEDRIEELGAALAEWLGHPAGLAYAEVFDLSRYSERIEGIGENKPYASPYIARKNQEQGWVPDNISLGLMFTPEGGPGPVCVALDEGQQARVRADILREQASGCERISIPGVPVPVTLDEARQLLDALAQARQDIETGRFTAAGSPPIEGAPVKVPRLPRKSLLLKSNIDAVDYREVRKLALALPEGVQARLPQALRPELSLKDHQKIGVAWLQHLWANIPEHCRGALLADDMGLGKTLQILTLITSCFEDQPNLDPALIVAPVSLLENWREEVDKFFVPGALPVLTLYGEALKAKRLEKIDIDPLLVKEGIVRFLKPNWLGNAKVVLTTYETLRDLEFSFATQAWSIMVCDEAQKIKNPNALVTRAAKKQKVRFKIACTGTPVENSLADLWSLFDFIQPGLLGALNAFGSRYRQPIEAETDDENRRIKELRGLIEPQTLRRTKAQVAKDLPRKITVAECRSIPLSGYQRSLYGQAIQSYRTGLADGPLKNHLGLIQYLRQLCTAPRPIGQAANMDEPIGEHEKKAPKLKWLLQTLDGIRAKQEKVIIFVEFHDLQRQLQRYIRERLGFSPDIINGTTSAAASAANSRQKRLKHFQQHEGFGVIILSPLAVGFGVNIQAANHVIHYTRTWNPAKEDQATDRAYRIGQTRDVYVYYPVATAEFLTFDMKLDELLGWKRGLSEDMLNGCGDLCAGDFTDLQSPQGEAMFVRDVP